MLQIYINKYFYVLKQQYFTVFVHFDRNNLHILPILLRWYFSLPLFLSIQSRRKKIRFGIIFFSCSLWFCFKIKYEFMLSDHIFALSLTSVKLSWIIYILKITFSYYYQQTTFRRRTCVWLRWHKIVNLINY